MTIQSDFSQLFNTPPFQNISHAIDTLSTPAVNRLNFYHHTEYGALMSIFLYPEAIRRYHKVVYVATDSDTSQHLSRFFVEAGYAHTLLPYWDADSHIFYSEKTKLQRCIALERLFSSDNTAHILPISCLLSYFPSKTYFTDHFLQFNVGTKYRTHSIIAKLIDMGYHKTELVEQRGDVSIRGESIELFPANAHKTYRLLFDFNVLSTIEGINDEHYSDTPCEKRTSLTALPFQEYNIGLQHQADYLHDGDSDRGVDVYDVNNNNRISSSPLPFAIANHESDILYNQLSGDTLLIFIDYAPQKYREYIEISHQYVEDRLYNLNHQKVYKELNDNIDFTPWLTPHTLIRAHNSWTLTHTKKHTPSIMLNIMPILPYNGDYQRAEQDMQKQKTGNIFYLYRTIGLPQSLSEYVDEDHQIHSTMSKGCVADDDSLLIITESELHSQSLQSSIHQLPATTEANHEKKLFHHGDFVVHERHGIGKYLGTEILTIKQHQKEYLKLLYADENYIYVPMEQSNFISWFDDNDTDKPPKLDAIGNDNWNQKKKNVLRHIDTYSVELIRLYARRTSTVGIAFRDSTEWQNTLSQSFEYVETKSQQIAIDEILTELAQSYPMDRLLCGDSGFGKTEVVIRAIASAVHSEFQSILMVPTTLLAQQHYSTLLHRYKTLPITVRLITSATTKTEIHEIQRLLMSGGIDVVITTHSIVRSPYRFKSLGLLIIDEEHRFGVKDKEYLKSLYPSINILCVSATPIPRSLHRALTSLYKISIVNNPPSIRKPTITYISEYSDHIVQSAIKFEIRRGGKVIFLHNEIASLDTMYKKLNNMLPDAKIIIAHGQLKSTELAQKMNIFTSSHHDVLLTTTIVESGLDIQDVNTIIINRAELFGISSLYQLRGRVGRRTEQGYAYLLHSRGMKNNTNAMKRLHALGKHTDFGAGYSLAHKDLEIRGAGQLLGKKQSGLIHTIGYELYVKILDRAIHHLTGRIKDDIEPFIDLRYHAHIPLRYVKTEIAKLEIYLHLATIESIDKLQQHSTQLIQRYGPLPEPLYVLFQVATIRILCKQLMIATLIHTHNAIFATFHDSVAYPTAIANSPVATQYNLIVSQDPRNRWHFRIPSPISDEENKTNLYIDTVFNVLHAMRRQRSHNSVTAQ